MDELDHKIIQLLAENARMPVKDIAQRVSLTSPAVSSRIHRLEQEASSAATPLCCATPMPLPGRGADLGAGGRCHPCKLPLDDRAGVSGAAVFPGDGQLQFYNQGELHRH